MAILPDLGNKDTMMIIHMLIHHSCRTLALVTCFSIGMALSWKPIAATQFAFYMTFGNLGISSGSFLMGQLSQTLAYTHIFYVLAALAITALLILQALNLEYHKKQLTSFEN